MLRDVVCWQVLKGTHRCGLIEHSLLHGQTVADSERIHQLSKHFEHLYADLNPGSDDFCVAFLVYLVKHCVLIYL